MAGEGFVAMMALTVLMATLMPTMMMTVLMAVLTIHYPQQSAQCFCVSGERETRSTIVCVSGLCSCDPARRVGLPLRLRV